MWKLQHIQLRVQTAKVLSEGIFHYWNINNIQYENQKFYINQHRRHICALFGALLQA